MLLHGFTGSAGSWGAPILEGLLGRGFDVTALDLPGHGARAGEDDPRTFTLEAVLAEVDEVGRRTAGEIVGDVGREVSSYDLVGYSMGGRIALHQALRRPDRVRRLVLESASPGLATEGERTLRRRDDEALARRIVEGGVEEFVDGWEALPLFASQRRLAAEVRRRHRERRLANHPRSLAAALRGLGTGTLPSLWERLGEVRTPTLLIAGALDGKFVEIGRRMAEAIPEAHLTVVPDAGHTVHLERPGMWIEVVTDFLAS